MSKDKKEKNMEKKIEKGTEKKAEKQCNCQSESGNEHECNCQSESGNEHECNCQEEAGKEHKCDCKEGQCDCKGDKQEEGFKIEDLSVEQLRGLCAFQNEMYQGLCKENEELIKKVDELRKMISKNDSYLDQLVSIKADFDSYKQRVRCDVEANKEEGMLKAIEKIFPFIDTLEKARVDAHDGKAYDLIYRQFCKVLFEMGIEEIDVMGKTFDHNTASAIMERESDEGNKGKVVEVYQKGFKYGQRVLRYAQVVVGK